MLLLGTMPAPNRCRNATRWTQRHRPRPFRVSTARSRSAWHGHASHAMLWGIRPEYPREETTMKMMSAACLTAMSGLLLAGYAGAADGSWPQ